MTLGTVGRRHIMLVAGAGAVAGGAALLWQQRGMFDSYPQGSPLAVELDALPEGKLLTVEWRGLPVWVLRRSAAQIAALAVHENALADPESRQSLQPPPCRNRQRSLRPDIFVALGLCTHQGCTPALQGDSGFLCPCHASRYDLAGRVFKVGPASTNLVIPAHHFETDNRLLLGIDA
ncbi:MAG: ubiquinol-cytochrome c reductase iron-sulfur subunit [Rhodoferax sp.]|uniref:ubiquinol-cytochrome c reductase iron-sulfur subunit n=1 Tax=Rhodoferax sp. TaxID=50421 RepID=UPI00261D8AFF|nr:ubiquinol-cytochrome c reductase iron-sulfur subunit [Rhodoferax sp.]MDD5336328.1 ubiquinol-cytochrome c reductase iron-sulfur subunit [Rhodoferax sp.]